MDRAIRHLKYTLVGIVTLFACSASIADSTGVIKGHVLLPGRLHADDLDKQAKVYIYLSDYTPKGHGQVFPWDAPIVKVQTRAIASLNDHKVDFKFIDLKKGIYGVSVLLDTGRPHVPPGSRNFTAFPGDYTGGSHDEIKLDGGLTVEVSIDSGLYVSIPDGYDAPLYPPD